MWLKIYVFEFNQLFQMSVYFVLLAGRMLVDAGGHVLLGLADIADFRYDLVEEP